MSGGKARAKKETSYYKASQLTPSVGLPTPSPWSPGRSPDRAPQPRAGWSGFRVPAPCKGVSCWGRIPSFVENFLGESLAGARAILARRVADHWLTCARSPGALAPGSVNPVPHGCLSPAPLPLPGGFPWNRAAWCQN